MRKEYPWDEWIDFETHTAVRGKDFTVSPNSFRNQLYLKAVKVGLRVKTHLKPSANDVTFRFYITEEEDAGAADSDA